MRIRTVVIILAVLFCIVFMAVNFTSPTVAEPRATPISPVEYAQQAVKRAKFRSEVASTRAALVENEAELIGSWNKAHQVSSCEMILQLGYSSDPNCIIKEALQQELVGRSLCDKTEHPNDCIRTLEMK